VFRLEVLLNVPSPLVVQDTDEYPVAVPLSGIEVTITHTVVSAPADAVGGTVTLTAVVSVRVCVPSLTPEIYWVEMVG
jgi:hypothetical protein